MKAKTLGSLALAASAALGTLSLGALPARAADFAGKPIFIVMGYGPGSGGDIWGRQLAERMSPLVKTTILVDNKPGGAETIATNYVMQSEPDGRTLLWIFQGLTQLSVYNKAFTADVTKTFAPISQVLSGPFVFVGNPGAPYKTVDELVAYMKANPGKANFALAGGGSLLPMLFRSTTKTNFEIVRYKGTVETTAAIIAGQVDFANNTGGGVLPFAKDGKLRILAVLGNKRSELLPTVPALGESALPELRELAKFSGFGTFWGGLLAPAKTPRPVITSLNEAVVTVTRNPEYRKSLLGAGAEAVGTTPEEFGAMIAKEVDIWKAVAKEANIQPE